MRFSKLFRICLLFAATATAGAVSKQCVQFTVPVLVNATNNNYSMPRVDSNIDAVQWSLNISVYDALTPAERDMGPVPINRKFDISAQLCVPGTETVKSDILQIAVHGNAWDRRYVCARGT